MPRRFDRIRRVTPPRSCLAVVRPVLVLVLLGLGGLLLAPTRPPAVAAERRSAALPPGLVAARTLEAKIAEIEAAPELREEVKTKLVELYRKALSNLDEARANAESSDAYEAAIETVPAETRRVGEEIERSASTDPLETLDVDLETPLEQVEQRLTKTQADLAAVRARRSDLERRLTYQESRPAAISSRLAEAKQQQEAVAAALEAPPAADEAPAVSQARRWVQETRYAALSAEIKMLDQELLSQRMRVELLEARRDKAVSSAEWLGTRFRALGDLVNRRRQLAAEEARMEAEEVRRETVGSNPLLTQLAEQNAALTAEVTAMAARLGAVDQEQERAEKLARRITEDRKDAATTLETGRLTRGLGRVLLEQRESLPDIQFYRNKSRALQHQIAEAGVQRLRHQAEARRIADLDQAVSVLEAHVVTEERAQLRAEIRGLLAARQATLEKALEADDFYLRQLRELDTAERELIAAAVGYEALLNEHLFWLRSADPTGLRDLGGLPDELRRLLSPSIWSGVATTLGDQLTRSVVFWLLLLVAAALRWKRRRLIEAIEGTAAHVGRPTTDSLAHTLRALALTLATAAPLPLVLVAVGWQLRVAVQGADLSHAVGSSLLHVALQLFFLQASRMICLPRGVAAVHFRWPEHAVRLLRARLNRLTWIVVPTMLVILLAETLNPLEAGGTIARLGFLVFVAAIGLFFYDVLHTERGALVSLRSQVGGSALLGTDRLVLPLLLIGSLAIVALTLAGYVYSVNLLSWLLLHSTWMIVGLALLRALALRWLLLARRSLTYGAAMERQQAALAVKEARGSGEEEGEAGAWQVEAPEVDLAALSDDSSELVKIVAIAAGLVGLYLLWSPLLPALQIFDSVTVWYETVTIGGEDQRLPITLADIGLALIYALATAVLARRLPAVLNIVLLEYSGTSPGSRYTVTTLTTYTVVAVGVVLVLNSIGARWSQLQWLVAALGVGIGFGLQEIVANFISGLIILFERPIRLGDVVTVGDTDGVVTKIRIRATTIRNWDRKELLVPNKEFITGRLLNWSLSDQVTRIVIGVGVAYGSDVDRALALMREAAMDHEHVVDDPSPSLIFEGFGDNALMLSLRAYIDSVDYRIATVSELHKAINRKFAENGIVVAFPQRDVHLDTSKPLRVSLEDGPQAERGDRKPGKEDE